MAPERKPPIQPLGERKSVKQTILETGAKFLQDITPLKGFDICKKRVSAPHQDPQ